MGQIEVWENGVSRDYDSYDIYEKRQVVNNPEYTFHMEVWNKIKWMKAAIALSIVSFSIALGIGIWYGIQTQNLDSSITNNAQKRIDDDIKNNKLASESNIINIYKNALKKEGSIVVNNDNVVAQAQKHEASIAKLESLTTGSGRLSETSLDAKYVKNATLNALTTGSGRLSETSLDKKYFKNADKDSFKKGLKTYFANTFGSFEVVKNLESKVNALDENYASLSSVKTIQEQIATGKLSETSLDKKYVLKSLVSERVVDELGNEVSPAGRLSKTTLESKYVQNSTWTSLTNGAGRLSEESLDTRYVKNTTLNELTTGEGRLSETSLNKKYGDINKFNFLLNYRLKTDYGFFKIYYNAHQNDIKQRVEKKVESISWVDSKFGTIYSLGEVRANGFNWKLGDLIKTWSNGVVEISSGDAWYIGNHLDDFDFEFTIGDKRKGLEQRVTTVKIKGSDWNMHRSDKDGWTIFDDVFTEGNNQSSPKYTFRLIHTFESKDNDVNVIGLHSSQWNTFTGLRGFKITLAKKTN